MSTKFSIGQMNQLADALEKAGFSPADITKLRSQEMLGKLKQVLDGGMEFTVVKHIIDCDAQPYIPEGWEVVEHQPGGQFEWSPDQMVLHLEDEQRDGSIEGHELKKKLEGKPVLNAKVLDYLLEHQELIPEEWKGKWIYFWGTIFRYSRGFLYVRCLIWHGGRWGWDVSWLDCDWDGFSPALLACSSSGRK